MYEPTSTKWTDVYLNEAISLLLITTCPLFLLFYWITYQDFGVSISSSAEALISDGILNFLARCPRPTVASTTAYAAWVLSQAALYHALPGPLHRGPRTPGGRQLLYRLNGFYAWMLTIGFAAVATFGRLIDPTYIARHWGDLLATANVYCAALIVIFYVKARLKPDNAGETLLTGHFWYDLFNGGELHPRTGVLFDWKHFNASRTGGLLLWTLIADLGASDLSFVAFQYQLHGVVTNAMIMATIFRGIIVGEYFYFENCIYGFAAIMPQIWTLQTQYLARYPVDLSNAMTIAVTTAFAAGWVLNHDANRQKSNCREMAGNCLIWGREAQFLEATYQTVDGKKHRTVLLYSEALLVTATVVHRCFRDEARCKEKYGDTWDEYCKIVKWRMIPGIF
ncbi:7-dehydrocholesterol reductase [Verticillium dahliae VdLs.17]|uniref:7-dehydrocholesterol reductase n=1 Tax=Verticillium dahliae (strain VdLs.17 / ATCC MYA-4575 / FGSC 10137) TaxID=498257 RepID=G2XAH2_VERDV|nr:7-dehydrocholesterol reductase [Verticillium dahliae VdLs.17]EGY15911.1 7-dehydrocholesterol reductase [Verticillium dahliae VdLs.17]KAH6677974.1 7-dehydrocholesterol reductase [Verticillium dahliae]KAH6702194.1 7-dehydrocholesterol reductase [Verticillium dahliae]